jgi:hypothetical protein
MPQKIDMGNHWHCHLCFENMQIIVCGHFSFLWPYISAPFGFFFSLASYMSEVFCQME